MARCSCGAYVKEGHDCNSCGTPGPCGPTTSSEEKRVWREERSHRTLWDRKDGEFDDFYDEE